MSSEDGFPNGDLPAHVRHPGRETSGALGGTRLIPTFRTDSLLGQNSEAGMEIEGPAISMHK